MTPRSTGVQRHAFVDLATIVANAVAAAETSGTLLTDFSVDLRSDAYGHGLVPVARALQDAGVDGFLVSRFEDAAALADDGIRGARLWGAAENNGDAALLGPALFGLDPAHPATPAMRLVGEVVAFKHVSADRGVSYGYTYRTAQPTTLALVALGFADGIPRVASNKAPVLIGTFTGRVTGRIAMDQFVVDLHGILASPGESAVLFGDPARDEPSILDWADAIGIAAQVITSRLGRRIERLYA